MCQVRYALMWTQEYRLALNTHTLIANESPSIRTCHIWRVGDLSNMSAKEQCRIAIKSRRRILLVDMADIIAIEARGNYVLLHRPSGSVLLRESISIVEEKLNSYGFVRVNRSLVVNSAWVEAIDPNPTRDYVLRVKGGQQYTVSRVYKKNLRLLAQSWIGANGFAVS